MTVMSPKKHKDADQVRAVSRRIMASPELSKMIGELAEAADGDINALVRGVLQSSINSGLAAEMDAHLGYGSGDRAGKAAAGQSNSRNGSYSKTVDTHYGPIDIDVPRDRDGTFIPRMVPKGARRITELDDMIVSLYAGGMTIRDIQHHIATSYGVDMSHETISNVTDSVLEAVMQWQHRRLDAFYPIMFLDAIRINVRDGGRVINKAAHIAVGIDLRGAKHILGIWVAANEGASFWSGVCAELANRGVQDVFIVACDGLKGLPEAIEATWPNSLVQTCVVHLIRNANKYVAYGDRKAVSAALRQVYTAVNETEARQALDRFADSELGRKYPQSVLVWERAWDRFVPFLQFTPRVRKMVYTTNAIESLNSELRKATRNRIQFPSDQAAVKALWLTICNIEDKRALKRAKNPKGAPKADKSGRLIEGRTTIGWMEALNQMIVAYPDRFTPYI
ncbi:IS256 family transposase [Corynebacterium hindlerae]|uniref:IS256 family transposase n=1 Tax=Corynebacterium hindlerae TaxID=699041 RepID=UPI001AD6C006|nr:IS256 family transposase [Corynebacterium hindlerae]QTH59885.1 IS256 family transposase [Corynebacterium hindlerae]